MDTTINRAEHEEFRRRMEEENKRQDARLKSLETSITQIHSIASAVERLAQSMESMCKEQERQGERLGKLESRDGEMWRKVLATAATAIVSALIGYALRGIGI